MAEFDPALVSTRNVAWNNTDRSVHYGEEYAGVVTLNSNNQYDCIVQIKGDKEEISTVENVDAGALRVAYHFWSAGQRSARHEIAAPVRAASGPAKSVGRTVNISATGAAIETELEIEIDECLELEIDDVIEIRARVVRKDGKRIAVQFIDCGDEQQAQIENYLIRAVLTEPAQAPAH